MSEAQFHICMGCLPKGQSVEEQERALADMREILANRITVSTHPCLSGCQQRGRVSIGSAEKWSWMLGNVHLASDRDALVQFVERWLVHDDGMLKKAERPVSLRKKVLGRLPPLERER